MGILKNVLNVFKKQVPLSNSFGGFGQSIVTMTDTEDFYTSWVRACIEKRAKAVAGVKFKLYRLNNRMEVEQVLSHELLELLYKFNNQMTKFDFLELSMTFLDLYGASPWYLERNGGSKIQAIYLMRPEYLQAQVDRMGNIIKYVYQIGNFKQDYLPTDIVMLKNPNPVAPEKGIGVIEAVRMDSQLDNYMLQNNLNLIKNDTRLSGVIEMQGAPSEEIIKRMEQEWSSKYAGYGNTGKTKLLTNGMSYKNIGLSPRDLEFVESQKFTMEKILNIFGVPKEIFGNMSNANRATADAVSYIFYIWTIKPLLDKYFEQLNEFLVPFFGENLWLEYEPLVQEDEATLVNKINLLTDKVMTRNESRELLGYSPAEGGDTLFSTFSNIPLADGASPIPSGDPIKVRRTSVNQKTANYIMGRIMTRNYKMKAFKKSIEDSIEREMKKENTRQIAIKKLKKMYNNEQEMTLNDVLSKKKT